MKARCMCLRLMLAAFCASVLCLTPQAVFSADVINLRYANFFAPTHAMSQLAEEFCKEIEKRTNQKVKIAYHPAGSVLTAPRMYDGVVKGIVDMGLSHAEYTRGRFLVTEALTLPLGYPSGWVATHVANDWYRQFRPKEWDETHVLYFHNGCNGAIHTTKPVRTLEDLKGMKIKAPGAVSDTLKALGGTPRDMPMAEVYDGIAKNVLDGSMNSIETLQGWKFAEVCKYTTDVWVLSSVYPFYVVMNKSAWGKLPEDVRKVMTDLSEEWIEKTGRVWDDINTRAVDYTVSLKNEVIRLSPDETKRWQKAFEPLEEEYIKKMVAKGFSEDEQRKHISFAKERIQYWTKKQSELGLKSVTGPAEIRR